MYVERNVQLYLPEIIFVLSIEYSVGFNGPILPGILWNTLTEVMMDICRPPLQWIDGRCYRRQEEVEYTVEAGYTGEELDDEGGDEEGLQHEIVEVPGGKYRASLQIAEPFYGSIIGKGGDNRRRLEAETKTKVQVPKKGQQGDVIIEGRSRSGVAAAASRFERSYNLQRD